MEKKEAIITSVNVRRDVDGTILSYTVWVQEVWAKYDYTYRFDYSKSSFEKAFGTSDESKLSTFKWKECFIVRSLTLK